MEGQGKGQFLVQESGLPKKNRIESEGSNRIICCLNTFSEIIRPSMELADDEINIIEEEILDIKQKQELLENWRNWIRRKKRLILW